MCEHKKKLDRECVCVCVSRGCPVIAHLGAGDEESKMQFSVRLCSAHTAVIMNFISIPELTRPGEHDTFNCGRSGRSTKPKLYFTVL